MALQAGQAFVDLVPRLHPGFAERAGAMVEAATRPVLERASRMFTEAGERMRHIGTRMTTFITLPLVAGAGAAFKFASDLNESTSKARVVFGEMFSSVSKWAANSARALGISRQEALESSSTFGNLFRAMGLGIPKAAELSTKVVGLASDLASFNNANPQEVLEALRAGLVGEIEPLRRFGVNLTQARIEAKALEMGLWDGIEPISAGAKAQAAYALIMQDTALAQGDFARTADGAANRQRILTARFKDTAAAIGNRLLPIGQTLLGWADRLLSVWDKLSPAGQKIALIIGAVAIAAGPLVYILGALSTLIGFLLSPIGLVIAALAGVAFAATKLGLDWSKVWDWIKNAARDAWAWINANIVPAARAVARAVGAAFRWLAENAPKWWNAIRDAAVALFGWLDRYVFPVVTRVVDAFKLGFTILAGIVFVGVQAVLWVWDHFGQHIVAAIVMAWDFIKGVFEAALTVIRGVLDFFIGLFTADWGRLWDGIKAIFEGVWHAIAATVGFVLAGILNVINFVGAVISAVWSGIWEAVKAIASGALSALYFIFVGLPIKIAQGIAAGASWLWGQLTGFVSQIITILGNAVLAVWNVGKEIVKGIWQGIKDFASWLWDKLTGWIGDVVDFIKSGFGIFSPAKSMIEVGKNIVRGIWEGIKGATGWLLGKVGGFVKDLLGSVVDPLGILSPSRVFADIGRNLILGLGLGIEDELGRLKPIGLDVAATVAPPVAPSNAALVSASAGIVSTTEAAPRGAQFGDVTITGVQSPRSVAEELGWLAITSGNV